MSDYVGIEGARRAIRDEIEGKKIFAQVLEHEGPLSEEFLDRLNVRVSAALVAAINWTLERTGDNLLADVEWSVWVVTKDTQAAKRDVYALRLSQALCRLAFRRGQDWRESHHGQVKDNPQARNLTTPKIAAKGLNLWFVNWNQSVKVPPDDEKDWMELSEIAVDYDLDGQPGPEAQDVVELETETQA